MRLADSALPLADAYDWNQALMDLGATICVSRNPRCLLCPVQSYCSARAAWDMQDVPPAAQPRVAERRGAYGAGARAAGAAPAPRFEGSRRWYRGRIVDALRALEPGAALTLDALGEQVKPDYGPADQDWLLDLIRALTRDGLIDLTEQGSETRVSLPA
jgi:A/G-specific adenine glycosylase